MSDNRHSPPPLSSWTLVEGASVSEAHFLLGDFCIDHFPARADRIHAAETIAELGKELRSLLMTVQNERKDLLKTLFEVVRQINQTA
jgi:hypothetical protein